MEHLNIHMDYHHFELFQKSYHEQKQHILNMNKLMYNSFLQVELLNIFGKMGGIIFV